MLTNTGGRIRKAAEKRLPPQTVNFWCHVSEGAFASFGTELAGGGFIFPVIATQLGASPFLLGVIQSIMCFAFLAQLLFAHKLERDPKKKHLVLMLGIGQRLTFIAIPLCLLALAGNVPMLCLMAITAINLVAAFLITMLVPPWMDLIAETIPENRVGRLFGFRNSISSAMGLFSGLLSYALITHYAFPMNYASVYLFSFVSLMISWLLFSLVDESPFPAKAQENTNAARYHKKLFSTLKTDRVYRNFLIYQGISRIGFAACAFYSVVAISPRFGVSPAYAAGIFATAAAAAKVLGNLLFPSLDDRIGHKKLMGAGVLLHATAIFTAAFAPSGGWFTAVIILSSLGIAAQGVAGPAFMMQVAPKGKRVGYIALSNVVLAPVGMAAGPLAGYLLQNLGHTWMFGIAGLFLLASLPALAQCKPKGTAFPALFPSAGQPELMGG